MRAFIFSLFSSAAFGATSRGGRGARLTSRRNGVRYPDGMLGIGFRDWRLAFAAASAPNFGRQDRRAVRGVFGFTLLVLALVRNVPVIVVSLIAAGFAWTSMTSTMNVAVQPHRTGVGPGARVRHLYPNDFYRWNGGGTARRGLLAERSSTPRSLLVGGIANALLDSVGASFPHAARPAADVSTVPA